jgi:hypothetical protein
VSQRGETRNQTEGLPFDRQRVQSVTQPILQDWTRGRELAAVRRRLWSIFGSGLVVLAIQFLLAPEGITGALIALWALLSVPVVVVVGCLLVLLRNPSAAPGVWWSNSVPATIGLLSLASLVYTGRSSPVGRAAWELVLGEDYPGAETQQFGEQETVDLSAVRRIRRYVWYAIVGSTALIVIEQVVFGDLLGFGAVELTGPELVLLVAGAAVVGVVLGFFAAVSRW